MPDTNFSIAIVYDVIHPLVAKTHEFLKFLGVNVEFVSWSEIAWTDGDHSLSRFDSIYLDRMGEKSPSYSTQIELLAEAKTLRGRIVNRPRNYWVARNKALSAARFRQLGLPAPKTSLVGNLKQLSQFTAQLKRPYIAKTFLGCCAEDILSFPGNCLPESQLDALIKREGMILVQEFIENPSRYIWRIDIVAEKIIVANQRFSYLAEGLPICNGTQGGAVKFFTPQSLPGNVSELALSAVSAMGLSVAGVDLLCDADDKLWIAEVNPEPDITLDHYEFPKAIADHLLSVARYNKINSLPLNQEI